MTKTLLIILSMLCLGIGSIFAQNKKVSVTLSYPFSLGDSFVSDNTGIADLGIQVRFADLGPLQIGISANANKMQDSNTFGSVTIKESALMIQPRIFGELNLVSMKKIKPFIGLGYTFTSFKETNDGAAANEPDLKKDVFLKTITNCPGDTFSMM